uniref:Uncharacterized protein n=1 Tax=Sphaerodactylus townsendi TaxID=933632 RepID=A0ACB8FS11_9SAUR
MKNCFPILLKSIFPSPTHYRNVAGTTSGCPHCNLAIYRLPFRRHKVHKGCIRQKRQILRSVCSSYKAPVTAARILKASVVWAGKLGELTSSNNRKATEGTNRISTAVSFFDVFLDTMTFTAHSVVPAATTRHTL